MKLTYLIKKEFIEIFRQKELLPLIFIAPLLQIIVLGYVVNTDIKNIPVAIVQLSQKNTALQIIERIRQTSLFSVKGIYRQPIDSMEMFKKGEAKSIIIFTDRPEKSQAKALYPEIQILMDGMDSNTAAIAAGYFNGIIKQFIMADLQKNKLSILIQSRPLIRFNPSLKSINYMGPGIVALLLTILTLFLTSVSIVREKEQQTLDTLLISPLNPLQIYLGKAIPMALIGLVQMSLGIAVVILWFGIPVKGNLFYLFVSAIVFLICILSYALLISTVVSTQQQALFFSWFSMITFILLAGLFTPVENIHPIIRPLADINPLRYLIEIIREIFLKGNDITFFYKKLIALGLISTVIVTLSALNFKRLISK